MVRGGVTRRLPAPWASLVLDSEGLWAVARNDEVARAVLDISRKGGASVVVPAVVMAETLHGDQRDARANRAIKKLVVVPVTGEIARKAASLKRRSNMSGAAHTIDALVVAVAATLGGGAVLTSDMDDINRLAAAVPDVLVRAISVS